MSTGIRKLHSKGCRGRDGGRCGCGAGWEASEFSKRDGKKIRKTFPTKATAKTWQDDANTQLAKGGLRAPKPTTIQQAWEKWYEGAKEGTIRNRSGDPFKPSALRAYEGAMRREILPALGSVRLSELRPWRPAGSCRQPARSRAKPVGSAGHVAAASRSLSAGNRPR